MLQRIGKYEILEQIGRGGQGTVYRARDTDLDRIVAIKVIDQSVVDDPGYLDALRREAQLAASLDHPNIVSVYAFEVENDTPYIVMEYIPDALDRQIRSGRLQPRRAVEIAEQVCRGLGHAGKIEQARHRDIHHEIEREGRHDIGHGHRVAAEKITPLQRIVHIGDIAADP